MYKSDLSQGPILIRYSQINSNLINITLNYMENAENYLLEFKENQNERIREKKDTLQKEEKYNIIK